MPLQDSLGRNNQILPASSLIWKSCMIALPARRRDIRPMAGVATQKFETTAPAIFGRFLAIRRAFRVGPAVIGTCIGVNLENFCMLCESATIVVDVFQRHQPIRFAEEG